MVNMNLAEKPILEDWLRVAKFCRHLTPKPLADKLARFILAGKPNKILDPCYGEGALVESVLHRVKQLKIRKKIQLTACDVLECDRDKYFLMNNIRIVRGDFLFWNDSLGIDKGVDAVICNPPYVGNRDLPLRVRHSIQLQFKNLKLPGNTNYWVFFLLHSLNHLRKGGRIAFILPTAWKYADYSKDIRSLIITLFKSVKEESLPIPVFEKSREGTELLFASGYIGTFDLERKIRELGKEGVNQRPISNFPKISNKKTISLGEILQINIGTVCGAVNFFLFNKEQLKEKGISQKHVLPVVSSSKHLLSPVLDGSEFNNLNKKNERVWLFCPKGKSLPHSVKKHIESGEAMGVHKRLWCRNREPWYRPQVKPPSTFLLSGMVRDYPLVSLNTYSLYATNTLYIGNWINHKYHGMELILLGVLFSDFAKKSVLRLARKYPDGLLKFEPSDLKAWEIPDPRGICLNGVQEKEVRKLFKKKDLVRIDSIFSKLI